MSEAKILDLAAVLSSRAKSTKPRDIPSVDEGLRLIKAFSKISSPARRNEVIAMVEHLASKSTRHGR